MALLFFFTFYIVTYEFLYIYRYFLSFYLINRSSTKFQMWLYVRKFLYHAYTYRPIFFSVSDSSDKTKGRAYLLKKKVLPRWDSNRGNTVNTVIFHWFLFGLEWILNLAFCLLKLLIFYHKLLWNIRSRMNSSRFWVFEPVFDQNWAFCTKNEYFRLKICLSCRKTNFAGQEVFSVFCSGIVFPIQNWDGRCRVVPRAFF